MILRVISFSLLFFAAGTLCVADDTADAQRRVLERYWEILVKSPKRGATFDRVYNHYVDTGQSAILYQDCQTATRDKPNDPGSWMLLGLVAERRSRIDEAAAAFQNAANLEPNNFLPLLYLGDIFLHGRRIHEAIAALEQAHERLQHHSGSRNDQRVFLQTLALAYSRFGDSQKSLEVWNRLAALFPNDPDILVQVAESMEFEGKLDEALKQYRRLVDLTDDRAERVQWLLAAIDMMLRQGNDEEALLELDSLLRFLQSDSYLADAVRDRIDRIFARDPNRQVAFYQKRIEQEPNDTASLLRLVKALQRTDRTAEAEKLLQETINVSPRNIPLRLAIADLLTARGNIAGAIEQLQAIDRMIPHQTDYLLRWGTLVLQNPSETEMARRTEAAHIWNRIPTNSPNDPTAAVLVADLFARNRFWDEAETLYKKAVELRPNDFAYRESLATFYHQRRQKDKVLETLLSEDKLRPFAINNGEEVGQLLLTWGYIDEAAEMFRNAMWGHRESWSLQYRYLEALLRQDTPESFEVVRNLFANIEKTITDDEQFAMFLRQEVQLLKSVQKIAEAMRIVQSHPLPTARTLWHLAVLHQAEANFSAAVVAVEKAMEMALETAEGRRQTASGQVAAEYPLPLLRFAAELYEQSGNTNKAIALYQQLVQADTARSGEYWKQIVTLQIQRGELPQALESSRNLLGRGTENAERLRFVADLFLNVHRRDEAMKLLQQALTYEPGNTEVLRMLAQTLAAAEQHEEAIELFWRLYERLEHFPAKLSVLEMLSGEYTKLGRSDDLVEYLMQLSRNDDHRREALQSLVRVYTINGEYEEAQNVLESLLHLPDDGKTDFAWQWVLRELVSIAERQDDFANAARYQEMLCQKMSDPKEQSHLFYLYDKLGDTAKVRKLFFEQVLRQSDMQGKFDVIDIMIRRGEHENVLSVLDFVEIHEPAHWGTGFRRLLVSALQNKPVSGLVREFRALSPPSVAEVSRVRGNTSDENWEKLWEKLLSSSSFMFSEIAPEELVASLILQNQFLPVLFHGEMQGVRQNRGALLPSQFSDVATFQDARFLSLGWLLREAMSNDFSTRSDNPTVMRQFRTCVEELRAMLPVESSQHEILLERLRLEVWLLDLLHFDNQSQVFPAGLLRLQIDQRTCQQAIWHIVRKLALEGNHDWQPAFFQILVTECINERVAERFKSVASSDARLSETLQQILDSLLVERKAPPIAADERNRMIDVATSLVKQSLADHRANPVNPGEHGDSTEGTEENLRAPRDSSVPSGVKNLHSKTDLLLSLWKDYIENADAATLKKYKHHFTSRYGTLLWILRANNREADAEQLELSLRGTAQKHPLWFVEHLQDFTQPMDEDLILFLALADDDSLETRLERVKNSTREVLPFCIEKSERLAFCQWVFPYLNGLLHEERLKRYEIFVRANQVYIGGSSSTSYAIRTQIQNPDQALARLVELDKALRPFADFAFDVLDALKLEPSDFAPILPAPTGRNVSLTKHRLELQGDRPIDRVMILSLVQKPDRTSNPSDVVRLFDRLITLFHALDGRARMLVRANEQRKHAEEFAEFLESKKRSSVPAHRTWGNYLMATLGEQLKTQDQTAANPAQNSVEYLQMIRELETDQQERALTAAEQLTLALHYVREGRFASAVAMLDSMELSASADLLAREWIAAHLAMKQARTDQALTQRGNEAADRLQGFRLAERDAMSLVPILQHFGRHEEAQRTLDHLAVTVSDRRLLSELFYKMVSAGSPQRENAAKIAQRILQNPSFLQNTRRLTADVFLLEETLKVLRQQNRTELVVPALESRLRGLRDKTDSRILLARFYLAIGRQEEAKALALELAQNPTSEAERRQMVVSLLTGFGLHRELEAMNRLLLERSDRL